MITYHTTGMKPVQADSLKHAAGIFAGRMARKEFGRRGDARTCNLTSWSQDGTLGEFTAFIGIIKGHATTGHNVNFTVTAERERALGAGRKPKGYAILGAVRMPAEAVEKIKKAQREGESMGETIARSFGVEPKQ